MKETIIKVEGMMCAGCENRVKNALKTISGVEEVEANHVSKIVKVTSSEDVSKEELVNKISDIGYEVIEE